MTGMNVSSTLVSSTYQSLFEALQPATQKSGEKTLKHLEQTEPQFPLVLCQLVQENSGGTAIPMNVRLSASIMFKNWVKRNWNADDALESSRTVDKNIKEIIRPELVRLMLEVGAKPVQNQLAEALALIASDEYPLKWPTLIEELVSVLSPDNWERNNIVLQTINSIFKKYRHEFRSNELFSEINLSLGYFAQPLLDMFKATDQLIDQFAQNRQALEVVTESMGMLVKIFLSFSSQDLPAFFEDHLNEFMTVLLKYLQYSNPIIQTDAVERIKSTICDIVNLYLTRYEAEFTMLSQFVESIWNLLMTLGNESKYDLLVGHAIQILTSVAKHPRHVSLFHNEQIVQSICEKIILPNMQARDEDEEQMEDEPLEYIRKDLEGSDTDTRRRAASELVRGLTVHFETQLTPLFLAYVDHCLHANHWKSKDTAVQAFMSISMKGTLTAHGITKVNNAVNINEFFIKNISYDLQNVSSIHPMVLAGEIKFILVFRNQFNEQVLGQMIQILVSGLNQSQQPLVRTYFAIALEKYMTLKRQDRLVFPPASINPFAPGLIGILLNVLANDKKIPVNEYIIKCLWKVLICINSLPSSSLLPSLNILIQLMDAAAANPVSSSFNHFIVESIVAILKLLVKQQPDAMASFEQAVFPKFQNILSQENADFVPYVFQVIAIMLSVYKGKGCPPTYQPLLPALLQPSLWETHANIPAIVRLLCAYVACDPNMMAQQFMQQYLGIIQRLLGSKSFDHHAFELLESLVTNMPNSLFETFFAPIMIMIFQRIHSAKTIKLGHEFLIFVATFIVAKDENLNILFKTVEGIQQNLFTMMISSILLPQASKVVDKRQRQLCSLAFIKMISGLGFIFQDNNIQLASQIITALFLTLPHNAPQKVDDDLEFILEEEDKPIQAFAFSRLMSLGKDKVVEVPDPLPLITPTFRHLMEMHGNNLILAFKGVTEEQALKSAQELGRSIGITF